MVTDYKKRVSEAWRFLRGAEARGWGVPEPKAPEAEDDLSKLLATHFRRYKEPLVWTPEEAKQYGYDIDPGSQLKWVQENGGFAAYTITPGKAIEPPPIEYATEKQFEILQGAQQAGTLNLKYLTRPLAITAEQARQLGIETQEDIWIPTGEPVKGELYPRLAFPESQALRDYRLLYAEYQRTKGELSPAEWLAIGAPLRPELEQAFKAVFPEEEVIPFIQSLQEDEQALAEFHRDILEIGRTPEVEGLLTTYFGATEEDLDAMFPEPLFETPIAVTEEGDYVPVPWWQTAWTSFYRGIITGFHQTGQALFTVILPNLYPYVKEGGSKVTGMSDKQAQKLDMAFTAEEAAIANQQIEEGRSKFREVAISQEIKFEEWWKKHPELAPKPEYAGDPFENPELLKDPGWWVHTMAETTGTMLPALVSGLLVTFTTKRPLLGALTTMAVMTPMEIQSLYQDLVEAGCPEERAAELALIIGTAIGAVEVGPSLIFMKAVYPIFKPFRRGLQIAVVKGVMRHMIAKGIKNFTAIEVSEALEEVLQGIMHDYTVSWFDEKRDVLADIPGTIIRTLVGTLPLAIFGGGTSMRQVSPEIAARTPESVMTEEGWQLDEITNIWYKPEKMVDTYNELVALLKEEGLTEEQAKLKALNEVARTPEGEKAISDFVEKKPVEPMTRLQEETIEREISRLERALPTVPAEEKAGIRDRIEVLKRDLERGEAMVVPEVKPPAVEAVPEAKIMPAFVEERAPTTIKEAEGAIARLSKEMEAMVKKGTLESLAAHSASQQRMLVLKGQLADLQKGIEPKPPAVEGVRAAPELISEFLPLDKGLWGATPISQRVIYAINAGLEGKVGSKSWESLTNEEIKAMKTRGLLPTVEAPPVAPEALKPLTPRPELTDAEVTENWETIGHPKLTLKQVNALVGFFADYLNEPSTLSAWELTRELRRETRAGRAENLKARAQQLIVSEGLTNEDALKQAISDTMAGELPTATTEYLNELTTELRDALFAKVYHTLKNEPLEMASTVTALTNALQGRPIPREPGVRGGSAYTRLQRVFGDQPKVLKAIDKMASEKKPLDDVVEGIYHETGRAPIPIDEKTADYLRSVSKTIKDANDLRIISDYHKAHPSIGKPPPRFDKPVADAFKQPPLFNFMEQSMFNRVLKELAWLPLDIGNFLRATKATFDNSYLRQSKALSGGHPLVAWQGHTTSWQSMLSQKHTEAEWELITRDPDYQIYEEIRLETGHDPLRVPAFAGVKGTAQWRTAEEFGFPTVERLIPRLTQKSPHVKYFERAFSAGTNKIVWLIWKQKLKFARRYSEKIASGQVKLREGESFDIIQEMTDQQAMLGNMIQRANLRRFSGLAPAMNAFFFAARSKIGRFLIPIHLTGLSYSKARGVTFNPRVMQEAWRDFLLTNAEIAGVMFLGAWLGLWDLEDDPKNAEFMSARIGKTRIDPWAGQRQFVVLYARLVTKTGISSVTGAEYDADPLRAMQSFTINSLSPLASIFLEFWTGRNFLGQVIDFADAKYWVEKITPFAINDVWEAAEEDWRMGVAVTIPAIYGEGVQTYTGDWEENFTKLGLPKYLENTAYGIMEPYYDAADFWSDTAKQFIGVDPATLTEAKGFPPYIRAIAEARIIKEHLDTLPNQKLSSLNADPAEGLTFTDYRQQWLEREKLVDAGDKAELTIQELQPDGKYKGVTYKGEDALKAFDADERTRNANLGNISQRDYSLLMQYHSYTDKEQKALFLEQNPELSKNPRQDYLRTHPEENAQLAVWGQAKILTREAYNEFKKLIKELDIPDAAIPELTLPPEESIETHFVYLESVESTSANSWETQLIKAKDPDYCEWAGLEIPDSPIASLELKVKHRDLFEQYDELETDEERAKLKEDNPQWVDDMRRIEAYDTGASEDIVEKWVERGNIVDEFTGGSSEALVWLLDNPKTYDWAIANGLLEDRKAELLEREPVLRINVEMAKLDSESEEYRRLGYKKEAYQKEVPEAFIDTYIDWYMTERTGYEDDWYLMEYTEFYRAMVKLGIWQKRDFSKVPTRKVFSLYERYLTLDRGGARLIFRYEHPSLDDWLVLLGFTPVGDRWKIGEETVKEKETGKTLREKIAEMERRLRE